MADHSQPSGAQPAVRVEGLTKFFGEVTALDRVDVVVDRGTVHGLVGANGAGKSTLLSLLFGLTRPDEGSVRLFGRTLREARSSWLDGVGGFIESPRFYPYLTGRANLSVLAGLDTSDSKSLIGRVLDLVGLSDAADQKVKGYSLGMRQRLGLAAAIIRRPQLVILDEPSNGMDPGGIHSLREALRGLGERGVSVLFSSHDIAQVDDLCDAVTVLDQGAVVFSGSAAHLKERAPSTVWRMRTSDNPAAMQLALRMGIHPAGFELSDARFHADSTDVRFHADSESLDAYMFALHDARIAVRLLDVASSPLEALMLQLTGDRSSQSPAEAAEPAQPAEPLASLPVRSA